MPSEPVTIAEDNLRCECGSLLAKLAGASIELKCRRCKRMLTVTLAALAEHARATRGQHTECMLDVVDSLLEKTHVT